MKSSFSWWALSGISKVVLKKICNNYKYSVFCKVSPTDSYFFMIELLKLMLYMVLCPFYTLPGFRVYWAFFWFNALFAHVWRIRVMCMLGLRCLSFLCVMEICWQFLLSEIHRRSALFKRFVYVIYILGLYL